MHPIAVYTNEVKWRFFYSLLGLITTFFVAFCYIESFYLLEIYPFIKYSHKTFIVTQVTELFDSAIYMSCFVASIIIFPLVAYHILMFFSSCWFVYQVSLLRLYILHAFFWCSLVLLFTNIVLLPKVFNFFIQWEMLANNTLLQLNLDMRVHPYLSWVNHIYSSISFAISFFWVLLFLSLVFVFPHRFYLYFKFYKTQLLFLVTTICMIITPPDFWTQIIVIAISVLWTELLFFFSCFRVNQTTTGFW
uniref:Sec-independent protein translocase n=1 Tax=Paralemanea sp. TaxID=2048601 RepID=A0A343UY01_9FLOR|nr:Sec-independent protein translocase [Paralemanea sp.]